MSWMLSKYKTPPNLKKIQVIYFDFEKNIIIGKNWLRANWVNHHGAWNLHKNDIFV